MEYLVNDRKFHFSYQELKEHYIRFCEMSDEEFMKEIFGAAHLACVICYFKNLPTEYVLSDLGIIHELIHLIHIPNDPVINLADIRELFKKDLQLA